MALNDDVYRNHVTSHAFYEAAKLRTISSADPEDRHAGESTVAYLDGGESHLAPEPTTTLMLFNSFLFCGFFVLVYLLYILLARRHEAQNLLLLIASYVFYGTWDWRFLPLLWSSTLLDFFLARLIEKAIDPIVRRRRLIVAVACNLGVLAFFKYFNFFTDTLAQLAAFVGWPVTYHGLSIILPIGISFYTFHELSYLIDVYKGKVATEKRLTNYGLFMCFFPLLVAGPIARAFHLLPQISSPRRIQLDELNAGVFLLISGYLKKVVVADNLGILADKVFDQYTEYRGLSIVMGILAFAVQIYADFSGYSDIARGLAKTMGFDLPVNFKLPYFARNPRDFWTRWHISLSTWLRDYLYVPMGGNRRGPWQTYRNLMVTMLLGGLWHGAAWNYVIWGAYHGAVLMAHRIFVGGGRTETQEWPRKDAGLWRALRSVGSIGIMLVITIVGWIIFRSRSVHQIVYVLGHIGVSADVVGWGFAYDWAFFTLPLVILDSYAHIKRDQLAVTKISIPLRGTVYGLMLVWIVVFAVRERVEFIYFQF